MKRVLIISDLALFPANGGNKARVVALMKALVAMGHEVSYLGLGLDPAECDAIRAEFGDIVYALPKIRLKNLKPRSSAIRRWVLDRLFSFRIGEPDVDFWYWPHWDAGIAPFAKTHQFDVVIAEYVFFSRALLHFGPDTFKVVDTHDKFTGRRQKLKTRNFGKLVRSLPNEKEEARGLMRADAVIAIQMHEAEYFRRLLPDSISVLTVGHMVDIVAEPLPQAGRGTILFFGSDYVANVNGLKVFIERCLPQIRQAIPNVRLLVAGTICNVLKLETPNLVMLGTVRDVREAYAQASVVINPVVVGTGLKTKSIEAMALGRALVSTACGAEGIEVGAGSAFYQEELGTGFAEAVIRLLKDEALRARVEKRAQEFVRAWNEAQVASLGQLFELRNPLNV